MKIDTLCCQKVCALTCQCASCHDADDHIVDLYWNQNLNSLFNSTFQYV